MPARDATLALVARRFGTAAPTYERHAQAQRHAAETLARRIAALPLPPRPRILEIGCGTGLLSQALAASLGEADWTLTDLSPDMLAQARATLTLPGSARFAVMDGEHPRGLASNYDLICSSLAMQWFSDLNAGLLRLARLLRPGGWLATATLANGSFTEWQQAHEGLGLRAGTPAYPAADSIHAGLLPGSVVAQAHRQQHRDGLDFVRALKGIGATVPRAGHRPLNAGQLRAVMHRFEQQGAQVTYQFAYGQWQRPQGVFVTGTDTGVGKTLVSAVLARAWQAHYWKPLQTGLADEPGDSATVAELAQLPPARRHDPAYALQAPLSPWAAAPLEQVRIDPRRLVPPVVDGPLVIEGAGGLYVPIDDTHMMLDYIAALGMPVVLAARSGLGTINHTLLSLQALRQREIPVLGVVMSGPPSPGNRLAIERFGQTRILAEIPQLDCVDAAAVARQAEAIAPLDALLAPR
ncbi:dethiobiotin synthase [Bordetella trematum]|uniref:dethiobiotin synthase n=1 Tax=Bordetella trematum TaxID=123899 RepID=UPI000C765C64|nr:dethiobiotin synthase [Bordetella trematum]AUL49236.1 dethiobiotin synthase [Bordetella trematum]